MDKLPVCQFTVKAKKCRFTFTGTFDQLMSELDDSEIPCKVVNDTTRRHMRIYRNRFGVVTVGADY